MESDSKVLARGDKTHIRHFTRADVDEWCAWPQHQDPLFRDYNPPHMTVRERDIWYADRLARTDHAMYAITDLAGNLVGRLFLRQISRTEGSAVLGVDLRSDLLSQGYGTDALRTFNRYFFCKLGFRALKLDVAGYNYRAQRVYEKLGWVRVGEHWSTYPSILMPDVFSNPVYEPVRKYFQADPGSISIYHIDMELTLKRWLKIGELSEK